MQYTVVLNDARKQFTLDQDKIFPPEETVKRFHANLKKTDLDILKSTHRIDNGRLDIPVYFSTCGVDAVKIIGTKKQMGKGGTPAQAEASAGIGLAYVVPIAVGVRWFPDKKGLIMGLAVAGFGFGAMGWVKGAGAWGHLLENMGISNTFAIYGIAFLMMVVIGGMFMVMPPKGWKPEGWNPPAASDAAATGAVDFTSAQMLGTPQFYMIFFTFICGAGKNLIEDDRAGKAAV